jgi:hypothetical protein
MSHRTELLEHERRKLSLLRNKLAEQEQRVKVLEQMVDDPLDEILEREMASAASARQEEPGAVLSQDRGENETTRSSALSPPPLASFWHRIPRRMPAQWVRLLTFIGNDGKTFAEVETFIKNAGLAMTPGAARTGLMNYRKDFGFVENPRKGFYKTTDKCTAFIEALKDESPANGGAPESQPPRKGVAHTA